MPCQNVIDLGDNFIIIIVCKTHFYMCVRGFYSVNGAVYINMFY